MGEVLQLNNVPDLFSFKTVRRAPNLTNFLLVQDGEGNSSLDYAKANKDVEMIALLQRAVSDDR